MSGAERKMHYCIEVITHKNFKIVDASNGECFANKEDFPKDHGRKLAEEELSSNGRIDEITVNMWKCYPEGHEKHEDLEHVGDWGASWTREDFAMSYEDAARLYAKHLKDKNSGWEPDETHSFLDREGWHLGDSCENGFHQHLALVRERIYDKESGSMKALARPVIEYEH